jgi:hypothetical protein
MDFEAIRDIMPQYSAKASRDGVPRIDSNGAEREKETIIELDSHTKAPLFDHKFTSPTYKEKLQEHIRHYIETQGEKL